MDLMQEVLRRENLFKAYHRVVRNAGAPGVDGVTVEQLGQYCAEHWPRIRVSLLEETYQPQPVRQVEIPKPGGKGRRKLGIPTVMDRLIQQAINQVLGPIFDPTFSEHSFGFRPGRSAHGAIRSVQGFVKEGYTWVVDLDLEKFFDRVQHDVLMSRLARRLNDKRLLRLIRRFLQSGILVGGLVSPSMEGTPQGGPLSPLLSNILLDELDKELEKRSHRFARYADDVNVYVRSQKAGERVMASLEQFLTKQLRLVVNQEKSKVARPWACVFLGFSFSKPPKLGLILPHRTKRRLKDKLQPVFRWARGQKLETIIARLNRILPGWLGYYRLIDSSAYLDEIDRWIRRRIRWILWRQWKKPKTRLKKLLEREVRMSLAKQAAWSNRGPWHASKHRALTAAITPRMLHEELGLISLHQRHLHFKGRT